MGDSYRLERGGVSLDIGSYVLADPGPDFGFDALHRSQFAEHPVIEGGTLAYEQSGVRRFTFPLIVASSADHMGLNGLANKIRSLAKPGAWVDLRPEGVASGEAVRFNILNGRLSERYRLPIARAGRRYMDLELSVEPFGYWPTEIILASSASVGLPGVLSVPNASIIGDVAGLARLNVQPSSPAAHGAGSWLLDSLVWGLGALASFVGKVGGGQLTGALAAASVTGNPRGFGSQSLDVFPSPTQAGWTQMAYLNVASLLEPAYRGRFRVFALARNGSPSCLPWHVSLDVVGGLQLDRAMGSAAPVATVPWDGHGSAISPSPAFHVLDLGELVSPLTSSGADQSLRFRLWAKPATSNLGIASPHLSLGGLYLLPLEGGAGIMPRGIAQPSILTPSVGRFTIDAFSRSALMVAGGANLATPLTPLGDAFAYYQGDLPRVVSSTLQIDVFGAHRKAASGATAPLAYQGDAHAAVSLSYRPRFTFLKGV